MVRQSRTQTRRSGLIQCVDVSLSCESTTEVTCRGRFRNLRRAVQVEVRFIVSFQFRIFQTLSTTERIVRDVEYMIRFEIREVGIQQLQSTIDRTDQSALMLQWMSEAESSITCGLRSVGNFKSHGSHRKHRRRVISHLKFVPLIDTSVAFGEIPHHRRLLSDSFRLALRRFFGKVLLVPCTVYT